MGSDALDHLGGRRLGREQLMEFAKKKRAEEEGTILGDNKKVKTMASKFEQEVARQRKAAGLDR
jgi:hypothetical protein